jgi:hypothetical protein
MTAQEVVDELKALGKPFIKKVLINHGACEPFFGVSVEDLKKIQKRIKTDHALALEPTFRTSPAEYPRITLGMRDQPL